MTLLIFILFSIFSTFHSLTPSISTSFISSTFCSPTCSLYHTIQLIFTTRWILIEIGSHNLTALVDIILLMKYRLMYWSTSFFVWIPSLSYSTLLYHLSFILQLLSFSYLLVISSSPVLFLMLLQLLSISSSFFLQTLLLSLLFIFF